MVLFIGAMSLANSASINPIIEPEPIIAGIQEAMGNFDKYYTVNEGEYLNFTNMFNQSENPNCPCNLTIIPDQYTLNWSLYGARMRTNTTFNGNSSGQWPPLPPAWVTSFFNWTPHYCKSSPMAYNFNVSQYKQQQGQDSAGLSNIFMYHINVTNVNRNPAIGADRPSIIYVAKGKSTTVIFTKSDLDRDQCGTGDDNVEWFSQEFASEPATAPIWSNPSEDALNWTWAPLSDADLGTHHVTVTARDDFGAIVEKQITVVAYQPLPPCTPYNPKYKFKISPNTCMPN